MASNGRRRSGDRLGRAAIGALLRTPRLLTVAQTSKVIGPATENVAENRALIEGLTLARDYGIQRIRIGVYGSGGSPPPSMQSAR